MNELVFKVRQEGAEGAAQELLLVPLAAEEAARRVAALNARISQRISTRARDAVTGASGGSVQGDVRAAVAAARLEQAQGRVAVSAQRLAAAQVSADAATVRAANSYQRATQAAERLASGQGGAARSVLNLDQILGRVGGSLRNLGLGLTSLGSSLSLSLTAPLLAAGAAAVKSARDIDSQVNTLRAFIGTAEGAEDRLRKLIETSRRTPGLTTNLAAQLDAQLRVAQVTEETIDRILPAIGRLNAVKPIEDPDRFVQNLVQLVTQNFERLDLKELVGRSPLAGQLIAQIFDVDSPINAEAIRTQARRMGITTVDSFFAAFAQAAQQNQGLANVTESIGTRFDKLVDRIMLALRPLGLALVDTLTRAADATLPVIERIGEAFASLPKPLQTTVVLLGALVAVTGPALFIVGQFATGIGGLISALGRLHALGILPTVAGFRLLGQVMTGSASLAAGASATAAASAAGWVALSGAVVGLVAVLGLVAYGVYQYLSAGKELVTVTAEQAKATRQQVDGLREHVKFLDGLKSGVARTSDEQDRLKGVYSALNREAQIRIGNIPDETRRLAELRAELERMVRLRGEEQRIQAATLGTGLAGALAQMDDAESRISRLSGRIAQLSEARVQLEGLNRAFTRSEAESLALPDLFGSDRARQLEILERRITDLITTQGELRKEADKLNGTAKEQSEILAALGGTTPEATRQILLAAKGMGIFKGDVDAAVASITKFRAEQGGTGQETKRTTGLLDEQVESLKQLKRALQEAEIAARSRSEAARRAFDEERVSGARFTEEQIANARQLAQQQLALIEEDIRQRREALRAGQLDEKTRKQYEDDLEKLELDRKRIITESADEIENLRSAQRQRERDEETRHREALISLDRSAADAQIDNLRAQIELDESLRLKNEQAIVRLERRITDAEVEESRRRRDLAAQGTEARARLQDELDKKLADRRRQRAEQDRRIQEAELAKALRPIRLDSLSDREAETRAEGQIERLRDAAERGRETFVSVEEQIKQLIDAGYARRIQRLTDEINARRRFNQNVEELEAERIAVGKERENAEAEGLRRVRDSLERDAEREREILQTRITSVREFAAADIAVQEALLKAREAALRAARRLNGSEVINLINDRYDIENARITQAGHAAIEALDEREREEIEFWKRSVKSDEEFQKKKLETQLKYDALRRAAADVTAAEVKKSETERDEELKKTDPFQPLKDRWEDFRAGMANTSASISASVSAIAEQIAESFGAMEDALRQGIIANILYGESIGQTLKKALAAQLAAIAAECYIQSLKHAAYAVGNLAFGNFGAAAKHAAAAAAFAAAGLAAGKLGGALAQSAGLRGNNSGAASAAVGGGEAQPRNTTFNYGGDGAQAQGDAAQAAERRRGGIGGMILNLVDQVREVQRQSAAQAHKLDQTLSRIQGIPAGQVVAIGAPDARAEIGVAVLEHSAENYDFPKTLAEHQGFYR